MWLHSNLFPVARTQGPFSQEILKSGLALCRSPETIRQSSMGPLDKPGVGLSAGYSRIDIKDRKKKKDWLFSCKSFLMRFGKGENIFKHTFCGFPEVLQWNALVLMQAVRSALIAFTLCKNSTLCYICPASGLWTYCHDM